LSERIVRGGALRRYDTQKPRGFPERRPCLNRSPRRQNN
jgi:hypothetical protein